MEPGLELGDEALEADDPGDRAVQGLPARSGDLIDPATRAALADEPVRGDEAGILERTEVAVDRSWAAPVEAHGPEPLHQLITVTRRLGEQKEEAGRQQLPWTAHLGLEVVLHPCSDLCPMTTATRTLPARAAGG